MVPIKLVIKAFLKLNNRRNIPEITEESMIQFYHYPNCSTCRNAQKWLDGRKKTLNGIDVTLNPPGKAELKKILGLSGKKVTDLLNKSGEQYRLLNMKE